MKGPYYFIVNPAAGGGRTRRLWPLFQESLQKAGVTFSWRITRSVEEAIKESERAGEDWIPVAVGGDGTLQAVVAGLAPGRTVGHLPTGRTNDFARSIGISRRPAKALHQLLSGQARPIDLPTANGRPFVGVAAVSFGSLPALFGLPTTARRRSLLSALVSAMRVRSRSGEIAITVDGRTQTGRASMVAVGNCRFFGGFDVCPLAHPDDGLLDLCVAGDLTAAEAVAAFGRLWKGTHVRHPKVHYTKAHSVRIDGPRTAGIIADGQLICALPVTVGLKQQALHVVVPREAWNPSKVTSILRRRPSTLDSGAEG